MRDNFEFEVRNREGEIIEGCIKQDTSLNFLYGSFYGRIILKLFTRPFVSKIVGSYMNSRRSRKMIDGFVAKQNIDMSQFEDREFNSYNDFFNNKNDSL